MKLNIQKEIEKLKDLMYRLNADFLFKKVFSIREYIKENQHEEIVELYATSIIYYIRVIGLLNDTTTMRKYSKILLKELKKECKVYPENSNLHICIASIYGILARSGPFFLLRIICGKKAVTYNRKALLLNKNNSLALLWKVGHLLHAPKFAGGNPEEGKSLLENYCNKNQDDHWAKCLLADYYIQRNRETAEKILKEIIKTNPENGYALKLLRKLK